MIDLCCGTNRRIPSVFSQESESKNSRFGRVVRVSGSFHFQSTPESRRVRVVFPHYFFPRISIFTAIGKDVAASTRRGNNFEGFETFTESQGQDLALTALSVPHSLDCSNGPLATKSITGIGFQTTESFNTADALLDFVLQSRLPAFLPPWHDPHCSLGLRVEGLRLRVQGSWCEV